MSNHNHYNVQIISVLDLFVLQKKLISKDLHAQNLLSPGLYKKSSPSQPNLHGKKII